MSEVARTKVTNRPAAAVALRLRGATYQDICDALGYEAPGIAQREVEKALASLAPPEDAQMLRQVMDARLEKLLLSCWRKATDPNAEDHLGYVRTALAIMERAARLHGLDAPSKHVQISPTAAQIQEIIDSLRGEPQVVEAELMMQEAHDDIDA